MVFFLKSNIKKHTKAREVANVGCHFFEVKH